MTRLTIFDSTLYTVEPAYSNKCKLSQCHADLDVSNTEPRPLAQVIGHIACMGHYTMILKMFTMIVELMKTKLVDFCIPSF